jgi:hypothetical protein
MKATRQAAAVLNSATMLDGFGGTSVARSARDCASARCAPTDGECGPESAFATSTHQLDDLAKRAAWTVIEAANGVVGIR